jgi:hypothetical protein
MIYLLPVMPFDCISIKMGFEALCPPGLGLPWYATIAWVLMEILPKILPRFDTQITLLVTMTCMESGNGYNLLWQILMLTVLGFDPTIPVMLPAWKDEDIFKFATLFYLYFWLQAKKGVVNDDRIRSTTFLNAVLDPAYTDVITTLLTCINNYFAPEDEGYLPINLCIMGLASHHHNVQTRAHAVVPRARRAVGLEDAWEYAVPIQGSPRVAHTNAGGCGDRPPPRDGRGSCKPFGAFPAYNRPFVQGGHGGGCPPPNAPQQGCYARPNHNKSKWDPSIICDACRHTGHEAANCGMLAMAIFLEKYKQEMSDDMKNKVEMEWLARWKGDLGNPSRKPRRIMKAYLDLLDMLVDDLDDQMCWECWPDNDDIDVADK